MKTKIFNSHKLMLWAVVFIGTLSLLGYLFISYQTVGDFGFPLDDGWIHQTYARNFANRGEWAYVPGTVSGGSTSPLWTILLSVGHLLNMGPFLGTYILGGLSFLGLAIIGEFVFQKQTGGIMEVPAVALLLVLEWHLCWAAVSGMETILHAAIILLVLYFCLEQKSSLLIGSLIGLSVWIRPDGLTLLGPLFFTLLLNGDDKKTNIVKLLKGVAGFLALFLPYLIFNKLIAGTWMPNTFYAKQTEYEFILSTSIWRRLGQLGFQPLVGVGIFLLPGFLSEAVRAIKKRDAGMSAAILWFLGYILIYALRLPVVYQHGRYLIPAMPVFFVIGMIGMYRMIKIGLVKGLLIRVLTQVWSISGIVILCAFWLRGGIAYAQDVGFINEQMVEPSRWIQINIADGVLLAAHDIGALGYFSSVDIVDLAGLVTPEIIPILWDEPALWNYLEDSVTLYLMTFPDWYYTLPENATPIYEAGNEFAEELGSSRMTIYRLRED